MSHRFAHQLFACATKSARVKPLGSETEQRGQREKSVHLRCLLRLSNHVSPIPYCVESLEPVSPNVPSAAAENQYRHEDDQKIGGVHIWSS